MSLPSILRALEAAAAMDAADAVVPGWIHRAAERIHAGKIPGTRGLVAVRPLSYESIAAIIADEWDRAREDAADEAWAGAIEGMAERAGRLS